MDELLEKCRIDKGTYTDGPVLTANVRKLFDRIAELKAQVAKQKPIIEEVAELCEYETEYDGRMERICFYCDVYLDEAEHDPSCTHLEAKAALIQESE